MQQMKKQIKNRGYIQNRKFFNRVKLNKEERETPKQKKKV